MRSPRLRALGLLAVACITLAGCNDDGRSLAPATATMPADVPTTGVPATTGGDEAFGLRVTSPDVVEGEALDPAFTCDGGGAAPTLVFSGAPAAAAELAVAVVDIDAADSVHFVGAGIPSTTARLDPAHPPAEMVLGRTDSGVLGWDAPCPPPGDAAHRYEIRIYAAAEPIGLAPGLPGHEAVEVIEAAAIDVARLQFTYAAAG